MILISFHLYSRESGEGYPLILLHGNGGSSEYFKHQAEYFSPLYHVIAVDTRGHGKTPRGTAPFTLNQFADDLRAFLDEKGITKANILGFSDGGNIALLFALRYPSFVHKLVISGANIYPSGLILPFFLPMICGYAALCVAAPLSKKLAAKKELVGLMATQPRIRPAQLAAITAPVLVTAGTHDLIRDRHSRLIADSLPNGRFVRIPGGHSVAAENSTVYNRIVGDFLSGSVS